MVDSRALFSPLWVNSKYVTAGCCALLIGCSVLLYAAEEGNDQTDGSISTLEIGERSTEEGNDQTDGSISTLEIGEQSVQVKRVGALSPNMIRLNESSYWKYDLYIPGSFAPGDFLESSLPVITYTDPSNHEKKKRTAKLLFFPVGLPGYQEGEFLVVTSGDEGNLPSPGFSAGAETADTFEAARTHGTLPISVESKKDRIINSLDVMDSVSIANFGDFKTLKKKFADKKFISFTITPPHIFSVDRKKGGERNHVVLPPVLVRSLAGVVGSGQDAKISNRMPSIDIPLQFGQERVILQLKEYLDSQVRAKAFRPSGNIAVTHAASLKEPVHSRIRSKDQYLNISLLDGLEYPLSKLDIWDESEHFESFIDFRSLLGTQTLKRDSSKNITLIVSIESAPEPEPEPKYITRTAIAAKSPPIDNVKSLWPPLSNSAKSSPNLGSRLIGWFSGQKSNAKTASEKTEVMARRKHDRRFSSFRVSRSSTRVVNKKKSSQDDSALPEPTNWRMNPSLAGKK